ncbi:hypothetical protein SXM_2730 [Shewanella xiamenensis]|nr:hypothetical protein SXM_2730 [Shewanella xiamenensis]
MIKKKFKEKNLIKRCVNSNSGTQYRIGKKVLYYIITQLKDCNLRPKQY